MVSASDTSNGSVGQLSLKSASLNTFLIALGENQRGERNHDEKNTIFHI